MKNKIIKESLSGAGYSVNGGRSQYSGSTGFGGGGNLAGTNSMYTYEIKPLNKTLEPKVDSTPVEIHITLGTYVKGKPFPFQNKKVKDEYVQGHVVAIEKPEDEIVAYVVLDEKTAMKVKLNPDDTTPVDNTEILDTNDLEIIRSKTNESFVNESSGGEIVYLNKAWNKGRSETYKFDTFKNPASVRNMKPDIKAIADIDGNLYVVDDNFYLTHKDIIDHFKPMEPTLANTDWSRKEHCYDNVICLQRLGKTNKFYLGELYSLRDGIGNWNMVDEVWDKLKTTNPQFKFFKESIADIELNESFKKGGDKIRNLGLGRLKMIEDWIFSVIGLTKKEDIEIDEDFNINSSDSLLLDGKFEGNLPEYIQFGVVGPWFSVSGNKMTSLRGCPKLVVGSFYCDNNDLTSLEYAPQISGHGADFVYGDNKISEKQIYEYCKKYSFSRRDFRYVAGWVDDNIIKANNSKYDNLYESFKKSDNKLTNLNVGKVQLIKTWLDDHNIVNYKINDDFSIDSSNPINLDQYLGGELPYYIQFNKCGGYFSVSANNLTTLKGCPKTCDGNFYCDHNKLTSLDYAPDIQEDNKNGDSLLVYGGNKISESSIEKYCKQFNIARWRIRQISVESDSELIKMENRQYDLNESFIKNEDKLKGLGIGKRELIEKWVGKIIIPSCVINDDLTLKGLTAINLDYTFEGNFPDYIQFDTVDKWFSVCGNKLTSLKGCPKKIGGNFYCDSNELTSLEYAPIIFQGSSFTYGGNKISENEILKYCEKNNVPRENMKYLDDEIDSEEVKEYNRKFNKIEIDITNESLNEVMLGHITSYDKKLDGGDLYMNPPSIKRFPMMSRAVTDRDGNFYISDSIDIIHGDIIDGMIEKELVSYPIKWISDFSAYSNIVCWMRYQDTNKFYLSESYDLENKTTDEYVNTVIKPLMDLAKDKNPQYEFILKGIWSV